MIQSQFSLFGQNDKKSTLKLQWELPVQIGLQYEYSFNQKFSAYLQAGLLRKPNSTIILNTMEALGTDDQIVDLVESAFQSGWVLEEGVNYKFGKSYAGIFFQQILLNGEDTPSDLVEILLDEDLTTFPRRRGRTGTLESTLLLDSNLFQLGLHYGRIFPLQSNFHLFAEFGLSFNIASNSSLSSTQLELASLDDEIDNLLSDTYSSYAHIPSITFGLAKRF